MTTDFRPGSSFDRYVLDAYIGGGSFGAVWRAHHEETNEPVALKLLTGALSGSDKAGMRADVELLAAEAARQSPHVVRVLGGGTEPVPYVVMEFVEGSDLQSLIRAEGRLSPAKTIEVGLAIADALRALNVAGIIHRDIKPANVLIDSNGTFKLGDFGIAKIVGYGTITTAGQAALTMAYAAPELWEEDGPFGRPSYKSDLYAMGVLLFECLNGAAPFSGNYMTLYRAHIERAPAVDSLPANTPPSLRTLIRRCLSKGQAARPADAGECLALLQRAEAELTEAAGQRTANEPRRFGPWLKVAPHPSLPWAWLCRHESSGQSATVEVHFAGALDYGDRLRAAVSASPTLVPMGGERILETSRLLMRPGESWQAQPAGQFQFWVAREDSAPNAASSIGEAALRRAVTALVPLIDAAKSLGLQVDCSDECLVVAADGSVYLRRPGIAQPNQDAEQASLETLQSLPLASDARQLVTRASDVRMLAQQLAAVGGQPVVPDVREAQRRSDALETVVLPSPERASPAPPASVPRPPPSALPSVTVPRVPPFVIAGGLLALVAGVALAVLLLRGGNGVDRAADGGIDPAARPTVATGATGRSLSAGQTPVIPIVVSSPTPVTSQPSTLGQERVVDYVQVETVDYECSDETTGCRYLYSVGPFRFRDNLLRIEFKVQIVTPPGKMIPWANDLEYNARILADNSDPIKVTGEGGSGKVWLLGNVGGVAARSDRSLPAGRYEGYWDFVIDAKPGSTIRFNYPDFENFVDVVVPR